MFVYRVAIIAGATTGVFFIAICFILCFAVCRWMRRRRRRKEESSRRKDTLGTSPPPSAVACTTPPPSIPVLYLLPFFFAPFLPVNLIHHFIPFRFLYSNFYNSPLPCTNPFAYSALQQSIHRPTRRSAITM